MTGHAPGLVCLTCGHDRPHTVQRGQCGVCGCDAPVWGKPPLEEPLLLEVPLAHVVAFWHPGRPRGATWATVYAGLINDPVTARIRERVAADGIGFHDHIAPVLLGSDGHVWDGHHRIVIALADALPTLHVDVAGSGLSYPPAGMMGG